MQKPYAEILEKRLAASLFEMPDVVHATLTGLNFERFSYLDAPCTVGASLTVHPMMGNRKFSKEFKLEIIWKEDRNPPEVFYSLKQQNKLLDPVIVTVRIKRLDSQDQTAAEEKLAEVWQELKQKAEQNVAELGLRPPLTDFGNARFADLAELQSQGYLASQSTEDQSVRLLLGSFEGQVVTVPREFTEAHAIVAGPPGVGKSRSIFIPNLIQRTKTSALVTEVVAGEDIMPTVFRHTSGFRASQGQKIYYLNPANLTNSTRFNPIDFIGDLSDAFKYATLIIANTTSNTHFADQIWTQVATQLLTALLVYVRGLTGNSKNKPNGPGCLGYVRSLLRHGPKDLKYIIESNGSPEARARFGEFIKNSSPNFRLGVVSDLCGRLNPWLDPRVCALTEVTDFDPDELRKELFTFYFAYPVHRKEYRPLMALALNFMTNLALTKKFDYPLTLILDEFAAYGTIPNIDDLQATIRNTGVAMMFGYQDQSQLSEIYSVARAEAIYSMSNTKIIFATGSSRTQRQISDSLGPTTKVKKQISSSFNISRNVYGQPLMAQGDIGRIPRGKALIIRNEKNPIIIDTIAPGTYNSYPNQYPPPEKPLPPAPPVSPEVIDQCAAAENLEYDQMAAQLQIDTYWVLLENYQRATKAFEDALSHGTSTEMQEHLRADMNKAKIAFEAIHKEEPIEMMPNAQVVNPQPAVAPNLEPQEKPADKPVQPTPKPSPKPQMDPDDPNTAYYVWEEDPNLGFYVEEEAQLDSQDVDGDSLDDEEEEEEEEEN